MRFISQYRQYKLVAVHQTVEVLASGQPRVIAPGFTCEWTPFDVTDWEREEARRRFHYKGSVKDTSGRDLDPIDDEHRVSVFDTASIASNDLRKRVEQALLENTAFGHDYVLVERPRVDAPYAKYDEHRKVHGQRKIEHAIKDIVAAYEATGFDVEQALAYERQEGNDQQVLAALESLLPAPEPEPDDNLIAA